MLLLSFRLGIHPRDRVPRFSRPGLSNPFPPLHLAQPHYLLSGGPPPRVCHPSTPICAPLLLSESSESCARTVFHGLATCPLYPDPDISRPRNPAESASVIHDPARQWIRERFKLFRGFSSLFAKEQRESYESVKGKSTNSFGTMNCRGQGFRVFFSEKTLGVSIYHASFGSRVRRMWIINCKYLRRRSWEGRLVYFHRVRRCTLK